MLFRNVYLYFSGSGRVSWLLDQQVDTFICIPYTTFSLKPSKFSVFQSISLNRIIHIDDISLPKSLRKLKKSPLKYV